MRRLCISLAALLLFSLTVAVGADENNWRFAISPDNNSGYYSSPTQLGFYPTSLDTLDPQDGAAVYLADPYGKELLAYCSFLIPGRTEAFFKSIKAPFATDSLSPRRSWDMRVYVLKDADYTHVRLKFLSASTSTATWNSMPASFNGIPVEYYIKMVDNRLVQGAPENGTEWIVPRMTAVSTVNPFFTLVLPTGYGSGGPDIIINPSTYENAEAEGYMMEFGLRPVPEPDAALVLITGLAGLAGFCMRKHKSRPSRQQIGHSWWRT